MTTHLLDGNVLIALTVREHEHHDRVSAWAATAGPFAICPISEGALLRYLLRTGESVATAGALLTAIRRLSIVQFWADSLSYAEVALDHVRGHRQVTDAYLAALAGSRPGGLLATLDEGLVAALPEQAVLVPRL